MSNKPNTAVFSAKGRSSLTSLQPVDDAPFKQHSSPIFIWFSIILVWMLSLLSWRVWPYAPDILLLVIVFWCLHEPEKVNLITAFVFGILMDVHDASVLGVYALSYILTAYGALVLSRRILRFSPVVQAIHLLPVFIIGNAVSQIIHAWLLGKWVGWSWLLSVLLTTVLWTIADSLLFFPQRSRNQTDANT